MIIKVCGLKSVENCLAIDALNPSLLGMIFYENSPRYIAHNSLPETRADKVGGFCKYKVRGHASGCEKASVALCAVTRA